MLMVIHRVRVEDFRRIAVAVSTSGMPPDIAAKDFALVGAPRARCNGVAHGTQEKRHEQGRADYEQQCGHDSAPANGLGGINARSRLHTKYDGVESRGPG